MVSTDARNWNTDDAIVVPMFSDGPLGPTRVALDVGVGGLPHASVAFCDEVTTIDHEFFEDGPFGPRVAEDLMARVVRSIRRALGEVVPEP